MEVYDFFLSLLQSILWSLGLYKKKGTIVLLGLDNAGKTTLLNKLRTNTFINFSPTEFPYVDSFSAEGVTFACWDLGGHEAVRHLWEDYASHASAVLFCIDASDISRLQEVEEELDALVSGFYIEDVPLALLLNKCDLTSALPNEEIINRIGYQDIINRHGEDTVGIFRISVLRGEGYHDALKWVASFL